MDNDKITQAANRLLSVYHTGDPCQPVRNLIGEVDIDSAYAVQNMITNARLAEGKKLVGSKIGLTSVAVQKQLGVDQPDYGMLFDFMQVKNGGSITKKELIQPKAEAEVAFIMKSDVSGENITAQQVAEATDYVTGAIEVVGSRIEGWNIRITDTISDNASSSHFVLGDVRRKLEEIDLINCTMTLTKNGEVVSRGKGEACMGSPLNAVTWLAQTMNNLGRPLKAGDIVLSGALGPMSAGDSGDVFEAEIEGLGTIRVSFDH